MKYDNDTVGTSMCLEWLTMFVKRDLNSRMPGNLKTGELEELLKMQYKLKTNLKNKKLCHLEVLGKSQKWEK